MNKNMNKKQKELIRVTWLSILVNVLLSAGKFIAGVFGHSAALVTDAVHSLSDVLSSFVVIAAIRLSGKKQDADHEYGHEKYENLATIILSFMLVIAGGMIGWEGLLGIFNKSYLNKPLPAMITLIAAIASIIVKFIMYLITNRVGEKNHSDSLKADAKHHLSDSLSSFGSVAGIIGVWMGFPIFDSAASVIISVFIIKSGYDIFAESAGKLSDHACDPNMEKRISDTVMKVDGVQKIDDLRTRVFGDSFYADLEISVDGTLMLSDAHKIAEEVHNSVEEQFGARHCTVHVNPAKM